jgi:hypothetical protein
MTEIALKDLKMKFHPTYINSGGIYWEGWENWQSDCELLGVILPVYNSGGVLNLLEILPRTYSGDHGAIALGGSRNATTKYNLLGGGSLILRWFANYDKQGTFSSRTLEASDSTLPDGFVPNPAWLENPRLLIKGWQSTEISGVYSIVENRESAKIEG